MKRLGASLAAFLAAGLLLGGTALASNEWCDDDPVITTLGATFSLTAHINTSSSNVSSIAYVIEVPENAGRVSVSYAGALTIPTSVKIVRDLDEYEGGSFPVVATVTVSGPAGTAVIVSAGGSAAPASATGTTGSPISLSFSVKGTAPGSDQQ